MRRAAQVVFAPQTRAIKVGFGLIYEVVDTANGGISLFGPGSYEVVRVAPTVPDTWVVSTVEGHELGVMHRVGGGLTFALSEPDGTPMAVIGMPGHLGRLLEAPRPPRPTAGESIWSMLLGGPSGDDFVEPADQKLDSYAVADPRLEILDVAQRKLAILSASYRYYLDLSVLPPSMDRAVICGALGFVSR